MAVISGVVPTKVRLYAAPMYYKRYEYSVLQTAAPAGWKWTVQLDHEIKTGDAPERRAAVLRAMAVIDRAIQAKMAKLK